MMRIVIICILLIGTSCSPKYAPVSAPENRNLAATMNINKLPESVQFSNKFRMFWDDLQNEKKDFTRKDFRPSENFRKKYNLKSSDGEYYIKGYIHTQTDFEKTKPILQNISIVTYSDKIKSFLCPISQLPRLITLPGITYMELSAPAKLK